MKTLSQEQFSLGSYHYIRYPFSYFLDSAVRLGFSNIEIWGVAPHVFWEDLTAQDIAKIKMEIETRNLRVVCFCPEQNTYPYNIASADAALRRRSVRYLQESIRLGAALGAQKILICPGSSFYGGDNCDEWAYCRDSIEKLLPAAEREQVTLVAETQSKHDCTFFNTAADQRRLLDEISHPRLKAMLDVSQMTQYGDTIADNLSILGNDLVHMHLTASYSDSLDLTLQGEELRRRHPNGRPLNTHINFSAGNNPVVDYLKQMGEGGYSHFVTLEICERSCFFDPEFFAAEGLNMMKQSLRWCL